MQLFLEAIDAINPSTQADNGAERLIHGRGGLLPECEHLCLDWFAPVLLLTSFKALEDKAVAQLQQRLAARFAALQLPLNLVYQYRAGGQTHTELLAGEIPEPHIVSERGRKFHVHLLRGQNHGLFLDMSNGRQWVAEQAKYKKVLNLFAYTCGFSVAALSGGADEVVNIDMAKGALSTGKQNHMLNDLGAGARFLGHDIFKSWGKLRKLGPYDLLIADPPSNQKGSFVATKDYVRLLRHLPELLNDGADVLLCLNAPELSRAFLMEQVAEAVPQLSFIEQIANPAAFADVDADRALKVLHYRYHAAEVSA
ncbi:class I SAM-dependent methyltransferase [Shewanella sp. C32]|uniref:Class I SAM-dependent methyltransferase n=1 Tax=Shewanella electrica TaxID=515560 RepID=A0ABT2FJ07_9GAMM|nr:class I SAM-dependent methyltransferase [Shewanella electrica]MCH1923548.1 class I SAM-dependent methyltransferase [Shewanella electrica]MCS4555645.1 class I SAM-dependent methyltransferase [Shewanella electrica]